MLPAPPRPWDRGPLREEEELRLPVSAKEWGIAAIFGICGWRFVVWSEEDVVLL